MRPARWQWFGAVGLIVGGGLLFLYSQWSSQRQRRAADRVTASRLLQPFDTKDGLTDAETRAVTELAASSLGVREAFLQTALAEDLSANRFAPHAHPLAVAISRVDRQDAAQLFEDTITPVLEQSRSVAGLRGAFHLIERWSLLLAMDDDDRDDVASALADRIVAEGNTEVRNELLAGHQLWAGQLSVRASEQQAGKFVARLLVETDAYTARSLIPALAVTAPLLTVSKADALTRQILSEVRKELRRERLAAPLIALAQLSPRASSDAVGEVASETVSRLRHEQDPAALLMWGATLAPIRSRVPNPLADRLAENLLDRIREEKASRSLHSLVTSLNVFSDAVSLQQGERIVRTLAQRFEHADGLGIGAAGMGIVAVASKASPTAIGQARALAMDRLRQTKDVGVVTALGDAIGGMPAGLGVNDEAAHVLVSFLERQEGAFEIATLDSALESVLRAGVDPEHAAQMANIVANRMIREGYIPELLRVVLGFQVLAEHVPESAAGPLAARLVARLAESQAPSIARALAFGIGSLKAGAEREQLRAATVLRDRILVERDPVAVRALVAGLLNVGEVPQAYYEATARKLAGREDEDSVAALQAIRERTEKPEPQMDDEPTGDPRTIFDPLIKQAEWERLALILAPPLDAPEVESADDDDEELADFHDLIVADDDGESGTTARVAPVYPIDFNRLSDAVDPLRPSSSRERFFSTTDAPGLGLFAVGLLWLLMLARRPSTPIEQ